MSTPQIQYLVRINKLQSLQQRVAYFEKTSDQYRKTLETFKEYIEFVKTFNEPKSLINGLIRMAQYCERMDDRLLSGDLYKDALNLMRTFKLGDSEHIQNLRSKIESLHYYSF
ncbi:MAG: hypothetical protein ACTSPA_08220 [Promethearchaeota archaeon]